MNNFKKITLALALVAVIISLTNIVEARINNPLSSAPFFTGTSSTATTTLAGGFAIESTGFVYDYTSNDVGIGTSASQFKLAVADFASASLADVIYIRNTDSTVNSGAGISFGITPGDTPGGISARIYAKRVNTPTNGDTELYFENRRSSVNTTSMMIDTSGNVGIGTTTPGARLQVNSSASASASGQEVLRLGSAISSGTAGSGPALTFGNGSTVTASFKIHAGADSSGNSRTNLIFSGTSSLIELMRLNYQGDLGLGTSSPYAKLSIAGTSASTAPVLLISTSTATATSTAFEIDSNGKLFIYNQSLSTAGNAVCRLSTGQIVNAGNTTCTTSSARFKKDIKPIDKGLDLVMVMSPKSYTRKEPTPSIPAGKEFGFIAEEVNLIEPRLVEYEEDGITPRAVNYQEYTAVLTKAIQEQQKQIEILKLEINNLKK